MKKLFFTFTFLLSIAVSVFPQNINGRFSSSVYTFERYDTLNSTKYLRTFQMLSLNVTQDNFTLRSYLNFEGDISNSLQNDPRLRFYNLYLEGRNLFDIATVKLGRQPVYNSVAGGVFDGVTLDLKKYDYKFSAYYGGNVAPYQKLELTKNWGENFILGGRFIANSVKDFQFALSYINKNYMPDSYYATRLDPNLNPIQVLIENNSSQYQFASAEVFYNKEKMLSVNTRFDYDLNFMEASKFEIQGRYEQIKNLGIDVYYNYRQPNIRYNSIFSVFDFGNTQEVEVGGDYALNKLLTVIGKVGNVIYKDDNSQRITLGLNSRYGSLSYLKNLGYAGEMDAISLYTAYTFFDGLFTPSVGLSYTNYKLEKDDPNTNNLTTLLGGFNLRPWRFLSFDLQGQFMNNPIYKDDFRLFFKLNYWFNTNLNSM